MDIEVTETAPGRALKVALRGRLDTAGVDRVETRFMAAVVAQSRNAIVDLGAVELLTSMGIRMVISAARAMSARHTKLVLFGAQPLVQEVLETAAIDSLVAVVPSEAEALALVVA
ncbi:Anti-sigma factor antagonist [Rubrivivax sp. A210]|uniref:STAS domain-containing protein n=1 Tax=Rubrivivax sp. A210 TaxID=2772301 RepID=UPI001918E625|nr:STAS domain-containing protein [Rubrivivax sp. A210]CAD5375093.1 Anti-sigma factor antagonist [Rubrivivax sp. A210]